MTHNSENLFQSHLSELQDLLISQLKIAGIFAELDTHHEVRGMSSDKKRLLFTFRKFYQNIRDSLKNQNTKKGLSQASVFIEHTITFNKELVTLKEKLFTYTFWKMIENFFFPHIQYSINAISKSIELPDEFKNWVSKTQKDIELYLYIRETIINLNEKEIKDKIDTNTQKIIELIQSKNYQFWYDPINGEHSSENLSIIKLLIEQVNCTPLKGACFPSSNINKLILIDFLF